MVQSEISESYSDRQEPVEAERHPPPNPDNCNKYGTTSQSKAIYKILLLSWSKPNFGKKGKQGKLIDNRL